MQELRLLTTRTTGSRRQVAIAAGTGHRAQAGRASRPYRQARQPAQELTTIQLLTNLTGNGIQQNRTTTVASTHGNNLGNQWKRRASVPSGC